MNLNNKEVIMNSKIIERRIKKIPHPVRENNTEITLIQRSSDNFVDLTEMCETANKKYANWYRTGKAKKELNDLYEKGIPEIIKHPTSHTWSHPKIALLIATWLNIKTDFEDFISEEDNDELWIPDEVITEKKCSKCKIVKALEYFPKNKRIDGGYDRRCKECYKLRYTEDNDSMKEASLEWYYNNKERCSENKSIYQKNNKEKVNEVNRRYYHKKHDTKNIELEENKLDDGFIIIEDSDDEIEKGLIVKEDTKIENQSLNIFKFNENELRTIGTFDEPWFVAKDICDILGLKEVSKNLNKIPEKWKSTKIIRDDRGSHEMIIVNESGLYKLVMRSNKPIAETFQEWVLEDVLPSIRKTGSYELENKYKFILQSKEDEIKEKDKKLIEIKEECIELEKQVSRRKRKKQTEGKVIYIIANRHFKNKYKVGISQNFTGRLGTYNTHSADDFDLVWYRKTDYNDLLEVTIKRTISEKLYYKSKEWYDIDNPQILIDKINKLIDIYDEKI